MMALTESQDTLAGAAVWIVVLAMLFGKGDVRAWAIVVAGVAFIAAVFTAHAQGAPW